MENKILEGIINKMNEPIVNLERYNKAFYDYLEAVKLSAFENTLSKDLEYLESKRVELEKLIPRDVNRFKEMIMIGDIRDVYIEEIIKKRRKTRVELSESDRESWELGLD